MLKWFLIFTLINTNISYGSDDIQILDLNKFRDKNEIEDELFIKNLLIRCNPGELTLFKMNKISKVQKIKVNFNYTSFPKGEYILGLYGENDLPLSHNIGKGYPSGLLVAKDKSSILIPTGTKFRFLKLTSQKLVCGYELFEEESEGLYVKKITAEK
jgi:hypothetical protein